MKTVVVLSGAGMSAESGLKTFRDAGGLWEGHDVIAVASPEAWIKNPKLVTEFYNQRRTQLAEVEPNAGHIALKHLEDKYETIIITQNVDDLHERAGSKMVMHLHGELTKMRSVQYEEDVYEVGYQSIPYGSKCRKGTLLRPNIVWFGEPVPMIELAIEYVEKADILVIVGTSLEVYPAAGLLHYAPIHCEVYLIDPNRHNEEIKKGIRIIRNTAAKALPELVNKLLFLGD
ncbi:MAG: NAD-dependent deacylase [Bacteroidia bacterium]|nr:NAD-dependent deacylase [Bacteroidia bacterium]